MAVGGGSSFIAMAVSGCLLSVGAGAMGAVVGAVDEAIAIDIAAAGGCRVIVKHSMAIVVVCYC